MVPHVGLFPYNLATYIMVSTYRLCIYIGIPYISEFNMSVTNWNISYIMVSTSRIIFYIPVSTSQIIFYISISTYRIILYISDFYTKPYTLNSYLHLGIYALAFAYQLYDCI